MWDVIPWSPYRKPFAALTIFLALTALTALTWLTMSPGPARADDGAEPNPLTLDEAVGAALSKNADLNAARASLGIARAQVSIASAYPNPELTIEGAPSLPDAQEYDYAVGLEQTLPILDKVSKRIAVADQELARETWLVEDLARRIASQVRSNYRSAQVIDRRGRLSQDLAALNERLLKVARARHRRGEVSELDVHQFDVELAQRRQEAERLDAERDSALIELSRLLNLPSTELMALSSEIAGPRVEFELAPFLKAARDRPDLKALDSEAAAAEYEKSLRVAERWADPTVGLSYRRERSQFEGTSVVTDTANFVGLQIRMPLPLLYGNEGEIAAAVARKSAAKAQREAALVDIDREVRDAHQRATKQLAAIHGIQRGIDAAAKGERLAEQAYGEGLINAVQFIQTQQQRFAVEDARLDALEDYYQALSDLEGATNATIRDLLPNTVEVQP